MRSTSADLDVAPELAERLLLLSEAAREHAAGDGPDARRRRLLLGVLLDDELCRHAWWVAAVEGEGLWRQLLRTAPPPGDVGPAILLAIALARRGAAADAHALITRILRRGALRRSALEIGIDLAEDAGLPERAWELVARLGDADRSPRWAPLRAVLDRSADGCEARTGVAHARWLRHRMHRWRRRPWSGCDPEDLRRHDRPRPASGMESPTQLAGNYAAARATLLPAGERALLRRWSRAREQLVTVVGRSGWDAVVLDSRGRRRFVGLETAPPSPTVVGERVAGRLLPTLAPSQWLLIGAESTVVETR